MIAVDTNVLVYAHRQDSQFHSAALRKLAELAEGPGAWAIPWPCLHEFLAIVTHPRIYAPPTPLARAVDQVDAWLESPSLVLLTESPTHWSALRPRWKADASRGRRSMTPGSPPCAGSMACANSGRPTGTSAASPA